MRGLLAISRACRAVCTPIVIPRRRGSVQVAMWTNVETWTDPGLRWDDDL